MCEVWSIPALVPVLPLGWHEHSTGYVGAFFLQGGCTE